MATKKLLNKMLGVKLFTTDDNNETHLIRIIGMKSLGDDILYTINDYSDDTVKKMHQEELKGYTPLEPDAVFTASIVEFPDDEGNKHKDIILTASKYLEAKAGLPPYVVARQNVSDIFYEMFCNTTENNMVGLSISRDTCPPNFDFNIMMYAEDIIFYELVNFYRTDTLEEITDILDTYRFDEVLSDLYAEHVKAIKDPMAYAKDTSDGWCRTLRSFLKTNNMQTDINQMLNITEVDFDISQYLKQINRTWHNPDTDEDSEISYYVLTDDIRAWLSSLYNENITEANVLEFDHDIDLAEFKNARYLLFRDNTKKVYLIVYTIKGEYLAADLEEKAKEYDFSTKFRVNFYNKYNQNNNI